MASSEHSLGTLRLRLAAKAAGMFGATYSRQLVRDHSPAPRFPVPLGPILLDRSRGTSLGVDFDSDDEGVTLRVKRLHSEGLVPSWNAANPDRAIRKTDMLVEVNGRRGSYRKLMTELQQQALLQLEVIQMREMGSLERGRRPSSRKVSIDSAASSAEPSEDSDSSPTLAPRPSDISTMPASSWGGDWTEASTGFTSNTTMFTVSALDQYELKDESDD